MSEDPKHTEFESLKNVWKQHYAEIKALKKEHKAAVQSAKIQRALHGVEASLSRLGVTFNEGNWLEQSELPNTQENTNRVDHAMEQSGLEKANMAEEASNTEQIKAKESLEIINNEMGLIKDEINKGARAGKTSKTIGRQ